MIYIYIVFNIHRRSSPFCEMSAMASSYSIIDTPKWFCDSLWKVSEYKEGSVRSPKGTVTTPPSHLLH